MTISTDGVAIIPMYQGRRISYPVCHPTVSHSQASHHVQDHHLHSVGAAESSVPILGFSDADGRARQRWSTQRQSYSENGTEEDGWQRPSRSRVAPASAREQVLVTLIFLDKAFFRAASNISQFMLRDVHFDGACLC